MTSEAPPGLPQTSRDSAVRAFPPRQFRNSCVSLESRYLSIQQVMSVVVLGPSIWHLEITCRCSGSTAAGSEVLKRPRRNMLLLVSQSKNHLTQRQEALVDVLSLQKLQLQLEAACSAIFKANWPCDLVPTWAALPPLSRRPPPDASLRRRS